MTNSDINYIVFKIDEHISGGTQLLDTMDLTSDIFKEQPKRLATIIQL